MKKEEIKTKVCSTVGNVSPTCGKELDISAFYTQIGSKDGYKNQCKSCINIYRRDVREQKKNGTYVSNVGKPRLSDEQRKERKEGLRLYHKEYRKENAARIAANKRIYEDNIKKKGIAHYGSKCTCCGESIIEFLTIEHKNGRKKNEKRLTGKRMWARIKTEGYPDDYTILCFNCNCARGAFGFCPHELNKEGKVLK